MIAAAIRATVGLVLNRVRGGGVVKLPGETPLNKRTQMRRIAYAFAGAAVVFAQGAPLWQAAAVTAVLFVTLLTGWGVPIGACGGWQTGDYHDFKEFGPIDKVATWVTDRLGGGRRTWGFVWLSCWGIITGFLLALTGIAWTSIVSFGLIGSVYWLVFTIYLWQGRAAADGWEVAELAFGFVSFLGLAT